MKIASNIVPELRFQEFDDEWVEKRLGEVFSRVTKKNGSGCTNNLTISGPLGLVNQEEYFKKRIASKDNTSYYLIENGEFAYNKSYSKGYPFGAIKRLDRYKEGAVSTLYICFSLQRNTADSDFMTQYFEGGKLDHEIYHIAQEGARNHGLLNVATLDFFNAKITIPSTLEEQVKISTFLSALDRRIEGLKKKRDLLKDYKLGLMQQLFDQTLRFTDEHGKPFPDWEETRLEKVATFIKGKGLSKDDLSEDGKTECIRYGELYTHYNELISVIRSKTNVDIAELILSEANDVIIPASGETHIDISTASCVQRKGVALGGDINIIRTPNNGVFLAYYLNNKLKHDIARLAQGVSVVHLYPSQLKTLRLLLPHPDEQQKIADCLSALDHSAGQVERQIVQVQEFKRGLLQKMFV